MIQPVPPVGPNHVRAIVTANKFKLPGASAEMPQHITKTDFGDRVEIGEVATVVAKLQGTAPERMAKILTIKRELIQGTYVTEEKLYAALDRMIDRLSAKK